jgi:hypothetical protein
VYPGQPPLHVILWSIDHASTSNFKLFSILRQITIKINDGEQKITGMVATDLRDRHDRRNVLRVPAQ